MGKAITSAYRKGSDHLLTEDESDLSTIESVLRMLTRCDLQSKTGKPIYSFTLYEKVKTSYDTIGQRRNHHRQYTLVSYSLYELQLIGLLF
jgi:hypothetical protein